MQPLVNAEKRKFSSAGREDIDVRMLGGGRPFAFEIVNARHEPSSSHDWSGAMARMNAGGLVRVTKLRPVPKEVITALREGEANKRKSYTGKGEEARSWP